MAISGFVYLIKRHSWDYHFHDFVVAAFSTLAGAISYLNRRPGTTADYNQDKGEGMVVEEWPIDSEQPGKVIYFHRRDNPVAGATAVVA